MAWFKNMKIAGKIIVSSLMFVIIILVLSYQQYSGNKANEARFKTFYEDRFVPVRELNKLFKGLLQVRINMLQEKIAAEFNDWQEFNKRMESSAKIHAENEKI